MKDTQKDKTAQMHDTIPGLLYHSLEQRGKKTALITLDSKGQEKARISYLDLMKHVSWYAESLSKKYSKSDRCLIMIPSGIEFMVGWLACLFAGIIAVPVHFPHRNKKNKKFRSIFQDADPACIMVDDTNAKMLLRHFKNDDQIEQVNKILIKHFNAINLNHIFRPSVKAGDTAYLQYTSGSTGQPKGVVVKHKNLIKNSEVITASFRHTSDLVLVNWLPPYHDMGLVGNLLQPIYTGGTSVVLQAFDFLKKPALWLKAVTDFKATTTGGPNFAFDYCIEKINDEEKKGFDLSSLNVFYCGSEPIRRKTIENFSRHFKDCNLKQEMLLPCYGLAENTLMATGIAANENPVFIKVDKESLEHGKVKPNNNGGIELVSCGYTWRDSELAILDSKTANILPENEIGEIHLSGSSVCKGYWNEPEESEKNFHVIAENGDRKTYLKTGDLGFIHAGHLYITGRKKDLIIIRGVNHFPQHIEETAENSHQDLQQNACAAFSVDIQGEERLIIVQEIKRTAVRGFNKEEIFNSIRESIASEHEISVYAIDLISPASIPKTSSGKIMRQECGVQWMNRELKSLASWQQENRHKETINMEANIDTLSIAGLRSWIINWVAKKTNLDPHEVDPSKPILSYGLDSVGMVELEREMSMELGIQVSLAEFLQNNNINHLSNIGYEDYLGDEDLD